MADRAPEFPFDLGTQLRGEEGGKFVTSAPEFSGELGRLLKQPLDLRELFSGQSAGDVGAGFRFREERPAGQL